ncbi:AraC family transcriptional regulator [Paenibacillus daejeonensis]|uniref:AraC family transcriptional regulator n=1 Tax=Paenibacillus daejeonensis TaxID=135193 RepID=UPI00037F9F85|nr:AraC family transcriptional regulator [Paenibacillus daejeonensis]
MQEYEYEYADYIYYTPGELDKAGSLWPVRAGRCLAKPNYEVGPKRIECYSVHCVQEGKVELDYEGGRIELSKGDLFCLFPNRSYQYRMIQAERPLEMSWLAIDGDRAGRLLALAGLSAEVPFRRGALTPLVDASVGSIISRLEQIQRWHPSSALELQGLLHGVFANLLQEEPADETELAGWIRKCEEYMMLHACEGITVRQVADFAGVHRSYFTQVFTSQTGVSPIKFLQKIRMDKAMGLLLTTDASVTEIGLSLGYANLYAFTRAFKMYFHQSPRALRQTQGS